GRHEGPRYRRPFGCGATSDVRRRASQKISPAALHAMKAVHAAAVKLPGTPGTTFISTIARLTAVPRTAIAADSDGPRRARYATHADSQPTPTASDPTSVIGTRIASPNIAAAIVSTAISAMATTGVPKVAWTRPSAGCTR